MEMSVPKFSTTPDQDRICVIANSGSGSKGRARVAALADAMAARFGPRVDLRFGPPRQLVENTRAALESGVGTIVACGGDGTICAVAGEVAGTDVKLGVVPFGTFNFFARGLGIPEEMEGAVDVIAQGHAVPVQTGTMNGRIFLNNASIGLYPRILKERETIYRRWGRSRIAAHWSVIKTMINQRRDLELRVKSREAIETFVTPTAFVMNSAFQLSYLGIDGEDEIRAGKLALMIAPASTPAGLLARAIKLGTRSAEADVDYHILFSDRFEISLATSHCLAARDGEREVAHSPLIYQAHQTKLTVLVPEADA